MKKTLFVSIFILFSICFVKGQSNSNSLIINSTKDIVKQANGKTISFYIKGIASNQLNEFSKNIALIKGIHLYFLKSTDSNLKMSYGKIELQNNYNQASLVAVLKKYRITTIAYNGQPNTIDDFFAKEGYTKQSGLILQNK